ncbi:dihydroorotate dehydrogenase [Synergistaceae bacterium OttesenSCG-928-D05]|nr:dihydroorotate dehydrogenase [Synergistaceae bacterium OttesenSCG-928-D05]
MTNIDLSVKIGSLELESPVVVASGVWPYEAEFWSAEKLEGIGAICTKAISLNPRSGNKGVRVWESTAGMMNSIGLQNVGVQGFIDKYHARVTTCGKPAVANVVMEREFETEETLMRLQDAGGIAAAELNISCPNVDGDGMAWGVETCSAAQAVRSARKVWKGPLWVKMTPQSPNPAAVAKAIEDEGADALVVANTWLGMGMDMAKGKPAFDRVVAGLSGPAIFPLALRMVWQVCGAVKIPVLGCGGVTTGEDCAAMMMAGASAVEAGTAFFRDVKAGAHICAELPAVLHAHRVENVRALIGMARGN